MSEAIKAASEEQNENHIFSFYSSLELQVIFISNVFAFVLAHLLEKF